MHTSPLAHEVPDSRGLAPPSQIATSMSPSIDFAAESGRQSGSAPASHKAWQAVVKLVGRHSSATLSLSPVTSRAHGSTAYDSGMHRQCSEPEKSWTPKMPRKTKRKSWIAMTEAISGTERSSDCTTTRMPRTRVTVFSGRRTRIVRSGLSAWPTELWSSPPMETTPGVCQVIHAATTTAPSIQFQPSRR